MKDELRSILSENIEDSILDDIINNADVHSLQKGEKIVSYGQLKRNVYIIIKGSLIRNIITNQGTTQTVMFHTSAFLPIVASIDSYLLKSTTEYDIVANEPSTVMEINFNLFNDLIVQNHTLAIFCTNYMIKKYYITEVFRNNLISKTPKQFLDFLYRDYSFFFQQFSAFSIANFMGITPEWFSKVKKELLS